jgi:bifunctional NMN adenylyltransferase/nudix hydrolase
MQQPSTDLTLAVVIGRFQPFHLGHLALLEHALTLAPRALLVVGSARGPRLAKNPFTETERIDAIRASLTPEQRARVSFATVRDYYDEPRWAGAVKAAVAREAGSGAVALVGFRKDESSSYLSLFPEWREHALPRQAPIDATELRRMYFTNSAAELEPELVAAVPVEVAQFLKLFRAGAEFERLREELVTLEQNREKYGRGPFITVDAVVTGGQQEQQQLLLVKRGHAPCKGLWALPGGFLELSERLLTAAVRELREETLIACSETELRERLRGVAVFDHPQRSQRGRTITHAHYFALPRGALPSVEGADDAQAACWFPLAELPNMARELCEDHFQIIDHFLSISTD